MRILAFMCALLLCATAGAETVTAEKNLLVLVKEDGERVYGVMVNAQTCTLVKDELNERIRQLDAPGAKVNMFFACRVSV